MMLRFLAGLTVQMAVFTALVMVPAWALTGGLDWRRGWLAVSIAFAASAIGGLWLLKTDPGLVRERTSFRARKLEPTGWPRCLSAFRS